MRSKVLRAMFEMETSKEYQTKQVDMGDYPKKVLEAFVKFLATYELVNPEQNASELLVLADKYDVQSLRRAAGRYLLDNVTKEKAGELYDLFEKVCPKLLKELFIKTHGK